MTIYGTVASTRIDKNYDFEYAEIVKNKCSLCGVPVLRKKSKHNDIRKDDIMGLSDLAAEYGRSADLLEKRLYDLRERMKTARGEVYFDLQRRIELLRYELTDTRQMERMLHDYYC